MSKLQTILLCIVCTLLGAFIGAFSIGRYLGSLYEPRGPLNAQVAAMQAMSVIKRIQENHQQDALELEEIELDGQIITLGFYAREGSKLSKQEAKQALRRIASHRKKFPYSSTEPELKRGVEEALSLANQTP